MLREANFDGLVGPTHNYAGLSLGNVASAKHAGRVSNPRAAALQGLAKMRALMELGLVQGILPPQERPDTSTPRLLGFAGSDAQVIRSMAKRSPLLLAQVSSASSMWSANAATVTPSVDADDGRVHLTPANLKSMLHRSIEPATTARVLRAVFPGSKHFAVHEPLPACDALGDEGAANHTRLYDATNPARPGPGVHLFVYGTHHADRRTPRPAKFPARQTREASEAVARLHGIDPERCVFAQQNPSAIDAGAFHNDVVCVGNAGVLLYHEMAFLQEAKVLGQLRRLLGKAFKPVRVSSKDVPIKTAVRTYLFNSQLVTLEGGEMLLVAPTQTRDNLRTRRVVRSLFGGDKGSLGTHLYMDVRESMYNGGGPACLRLRVPMTDAQLAAVAPGCICTPGQLDKLEDWVGRHYRQRLVPADLADPKLLEESRGALAELTKILGIGRVYRFQGR